MPKSTKSQYAPVNLSLVEKAELEEAGVRYKRDRIAQQVHGVPFDALPSRIQKELTALAQRIVQADSRTHFRPKPGHHRQSGTN